MSEDEQTKAAKKKVRILVGVIALVGAILYAIALPTTAVHYERVDYVGWQMLFLGVMGLIAGHVGWLANLGAPLSLMFSLIATRTGAAFALVLSGGSTLLALTSWYTLAHFAVFGRNEGESAGDLLSYGPSIYLWHGAILATLAAAIVALVLSPKNKLSPKKISLSGHRSN